MEKCNDRSLDTRVNQLANRKNRIVMGITQLNFEGKNKVEVAIDLLRACEPPDDYYGADSGGKDSIAIRLLSRLARVRVDWHYCVSPIDPPEVHQFLRQYHPDTQWDYHARGFWKLVHKKGLPLRQARWCCEVIKEAGGLGRTIIVGNRRLESANRSKQKCFEKHSKVDKIFLRPIIDWTEGEVWELIRKHNEPYCTLYDEGFKRLGCVLCPFVRDVKREIERFPKIARLWRLSCDHIMKRRLAKGNATFKDGQELWDWWISRK